MKTIKKVLTLMLTLLFFTCASGFVVTIHHCCHCEPVALETSKEDCCGCETHDNSQPSCCSDEMLFVKIHDSFDKKDTQPNTKVNVQSIEIAFLVPHSYNNGLFVQGQALRYNPHPLTPLLTGRAFVRFAHQQTLYA
jgi:hypothetical protein